MGRPRRPDYLKVISGTDRPDRPELPTVAGDLVMDELPPVPDYMPNDDARKEWEKVTRLLLERGQLDELKLSAIGMYCALHGKVQQAMRAGADVRASTWAQLNRLMRDLGITQGAAPPAPSGNDAKKPSRWADLKSRAKEPDAS